MAGPHNQAGAEAHTLFKGIRGRRCPVTGSWTSLRRSAPDSANPIAYPRNVTAFITRIASAFALIAALTWIVFPAVVFASTSANHVERDACPCCDGAAALGTIIACPGCQAAAPADIGLSIPYRTFSAVWLGVPGATFAGIDPVPAEPPPR